MLRKIKQSFSTFHMAKKKKKACRMIYFPRKEQCPVKKNCKGNFMVADTP